MSGNKPQFVFEIALDPTARFPLTLISHETAVLAPGTMVRLHVGSASPFSWCMPGVYPTPNDWFRTDLVWQFTGNNSKHLAEWQAVIAELMGAN